MGSYLVGAVLLAMGGRPCRGWLDRRPQGQCPTQGPGQPRGGVCSHASPGPGALVAPWPLPHGPADPLPVLVSPSPSCSSCPIPRGDCHRGPGLSGQPNHAHPVLPGSGGRWLDPEPRSLCEPRASGVSLAGGCPHHLAFRPLSSASQDGSQVRPIPGGGRDREVPRQVTQPSRKGWATHLSPATHGSGAAALPAGVQALSKDSRRPPAQAKEAFQPLCPGEPRTCTTHTAGVWAAGCVRACQLQPRCPTSSPPGAAPPPTMTPELQETGGERSGCQLHSRSVTTSSAASGYFSSAAASARNPVQPGCAEGRSLPAQAGASFAE